MTCWNCLRSKAFRRSTDFDQSLCCHQVCIIILMNLPTGYWWKKRCSFTDGLLCGRVLGEESEPWWSFHMIYISVIFLHLICLFSHSELNNIVWILSPCVLQEPPQNELEIDVPITKWWHHLTQRSTGMARDARAGWLQQGAPPHCKPQVCKPQVCKPQVRTSQVRKSHVLHTLLTPRSPISSCNLTFLYTSSCLPAQSVPLGSLKSSCSVLFYRSIVLYLTLTLTLTL